MGDDGALGLSAGARRDHGPAGRSRVGRRPGRHARHPDGRTPTTNSPRRRRIARSRSSSPASAALIDAVHRHHLISARTHFEGVLRDTSANVVCGIGFADLSGFTALTQLLTPAELSGLLNEFSGHRQRRGARRRRTGGEVHRRRGDVGELDARTAGQGGGRPGRTPEGARGADCRSAPASATARCWPSAATTSAIRSTWPPGWSRPRRPDRSLPSRPSATSCPSGPPIVQEPLTLKGFDAPVTAYDLHLAADG